MTNVVDCSQVAKEDAFESSQEAVGSIAWQSRRGQILAPQKRQTAKLVTMNSQRQLFPKLLSD